MTALEKVKAARAEADEKRLAAEAEKDQHDIHTPVPAQQARRKAAAIAMGNACVRRDTLDQVIEWMEEGGE